MFCAFLLWVSVSGSSLTHAAGSLDNLIYICPTAGSDWQSTETPLIMGFDDQVRSDLSITVNGSVSGAVPFSEYVSGDGRRLVLTPLHPFSHGEEVRVRVESPCSGRVEWQFMVRPVDPVRPAPVETEPPGQPFTPDPYPLSPAGNSPNAVALPSDFPLFTFNTYGTTAPGNLFFSPMNPMGGNTSTYLIIAGPGGDVLFYNNGVSGYFGPEVQSDGCLYYAYGGIMTDETFFTMLDMNYVPVDSFMVVGYTTDCHGMTVAQNDNVILLGMDERYIDMSLIVPGGNPNALVQGLLIQEQDRNHMPVFQWSSFDHFEITDACSYVNLTGPVVDYVHCNSVDEDQDGGILVSCLAMTECTKIDRSTGELVWRFGGYLSENPSFTILNDPLGGFSSQHDFRHVEGNLYSVFDNGTHHSPQISRGSIYEIDSQNLTADLVFNFQVPGLYGSHMGSTQVLPNGNVLVGWGDVTGYQVRPDMTEVSPAGTQVFRGRMNQLVLESYRAYRFDWEGQALVPYLVALVLPAQNCVQLTFNVFGEVEYSSYDIYQGTTPGNLSFLLNTQNRQINVWELPVGMNYFAVKARDMQGIPTGFSNIDSAMVTWTGLEGRFAAEVQQSLSVSAYPNPASSSVTVVWPGISAGSVIEMFDTSGRIVARSIQDEASEACSGVMSVEDLPNGLYTIRVRTAELAGSTRVTVIR